MSTEEPSTYRDTAPLVDDAISWVACTCYVWPVYAFMPIGRCGKCKHRPSMKVPAPIGGKALPWRTYLRRIVDRGE